MAAVDHSSAYSTFAFTEDDSAAAAASAGAGAPYEVLVASGEIGLADDGAVGGVAGVTTTTTTSVARGPTKSTTTATAPAVDKSYRRYTKDVVAAWQIRDFLANKGGQGYSAYINERAGVKKAPCAALPEMRIKYDVKEFTGGGGGGGAAGGGGFGGRGGGFGGGGASGGGFGGRGGGGFGGGRGGGGDDDNGGGGGGKSMTIELVYPNEDEEGGDFKSWVGEVYDPRVVQYFKENSRKIFPEDEEIVSDKVLAKLLRPQLPRKKEESHEDLCRLKIRSTPRTKGTESYKLFGRFAGGVDPRTSTFSDADAVVVMDGREYVLKADHPSTSFPMETLFYTVIELEDGHKEQVDKVPIMLPNGEQATCARTGRLLYRYLTAEGDCKKNFRVQPYVEFTNLWSTNHTTFGSVWTLKAALVKPVEPEETFTFAETEGSSGGVVVGAAAVDLARRFVVARAEDDN